MKIAREEEDSRGIRLCILCSKIELSFGPVDLPPLERADLPHPHAAVVGKTDGDLCVIR